MIDITGLREDKRPQSSTIVHALLDRLEAAEKERDNANAAAAGIALHAGAMQARLEAALMAKLEATEKERDALRTALADLLNDLEERAKWNLEESQRVIACGNGVYMRAKAALDGSK